ncbi:MAG: SpoIIE family protein phosphatase [Lachnospiraceae bacterium]|nr:SpoIIE family protein phosphatase [Lachnospiraceae bacterium]
MKPKRTSIKNQIRLLIVFTAVFALVLTSVSGIISMFLIKGKSADSLTGQMKETIEKVVDGQARLADSRLGLYANYITTIANVISDMYENPDGYVPSEVLPPDAKNKDILSMQRYFTTKAVKKEDVIDELSLFGGLEGLWTSIIKDHSAFITNIYFANDRFMICCDKNANLAELDPDGESYYDYGRMEWYANALKSEKGEADFLKCYLDSYGRGLMTSCSAPVFVDEDVVGVISMDVRMTDLIKRITNVSFGYGSHVYLVDRDGDIFASDNMDSDSDDFENILTSGLVKAELAQKIIGEEDVVERGENGIIYASGTIMSTGWKLVISVPETLILEPIEDMNDYIGVTILVFVFLFIIVGTVVIMLGARLARLFTGPIIALEKDVEVIAGGNLNHKAQVRANNELGDLAHCVNSMAVSLDNYINDLTRITAEKERIGAELDVATHIQSSMLPCIFPAFPDRKEFDVYASMTPAKEVGGDFYDFFMVDDSHVAFVVADVSGKGVPAALFMVIGKTLIKDHTVPGANLETVFREVNNILCESNSENMFITAFECVLDLVTGELRFINAGHETPFIYRKGGCFEEYPVKACFVLAGMEDMAYKGGSVVLEPGDKLFQYTDGVTEATDENNELYGMERLSNILGTIGDKTPDEILPAVKADIDAFVKDAPQFDDITMLCLEFKEKMVK